MKNLRLSVLVQREREVQQSRVSNWTTLNEVQGLNGHVSDNSATLFSRWTRIDHCSCPASVLAIMLRGLFSFETWSHLVALDPPGTCCTDESGLELREICPLPPEPWD